MYIHLGRDYVLNDRDIIGIFNLETTTISPRGREFLNYAQKNGAVVSLSDELPQSYVLADGAVEKILSKWAEVKDKGYAGLVGLDADFAGNVIGKGFPVNMTETTISGYYAAGGAGDKKLVYRTDVINAYPEYPLFEGEKYVSLSYKYLLIDQNYKLAVLDDILCNVEYQPDGSSNNMFRQYLKNPKGFAFWRTVKMQYPESFKRLVMDCIHYCSSSQLAGNRHYIKESPRKLLTVLCTPAGWALTGYIRRRVSC